MRPLSIGVMLSISWTRADEVRAYARHVEDVGLDALFVGDHLAPASPYWESTVTLATAAAVTQRIRVGFGVMVLALRHPAWAAKQIATLQHLSGNRVILGIGTGGSLHGVAAWEAVGVPYRERGRYTDDALAVLPGLIAGESTRLASGASITLAPGAVVPPIWIGGDTEAARRRSVERGSAWFPSMLLPADVARGHRRLTDLAAEGGRSAPGIAVGGAVLLGAADETAAVDRFTASLTRGYGIPSERAVRLPITGSPAQAAERFAEYAEAGAGHLVLGLIDGDWRRQVELIAEARALANSGPSDTTDHAMQPGPYPLAGGVTAVRTRSP